MAIPSKPIVWIGSAKDDLLGFPEEVRGAVGYALYEAQQGKKHPRAKPLQGFGGAGVLEVIEDHDGDTYRAVYTVRLAGRVYVLHVFQKKSKSGIKTPKLETDLVKRRLKRAEEHKVEIGSDNIFADIGLPNPDEHLAKAELASKIGEVLRQRRLTQAAAAEILGIDQPKVSRLLRGYLTNFSAERLMYFLTLLGRDVEIVVKPIPRSRRRGHVRVIKAA